MLASGSSAIRPVLQGPRRPATVLGVAASALYLRVDTTVLAVLTHDAVRLPCAVVLASSSAEFSLRAVPPDGDVTVGAGSVRWTSAGRAVAVDVVREWWPAEVRAVVPRPDRLAELRAGVAAVDIEVDPTAPPHLLVGRGPGLTPSGDDVVAGYLLGCRAFGVPAPAVGGWHRTTALSAALLEHAAAGRAVPEVAAVIAGLASPAPLEPAVAALLRVGHTSGAALAAGLLRASGDLRVEWRAIARHSRDNSPLAEVGR